MLCLGPCHIIFLLKTTFGSSLRDKVKTHSKKKQAPCNIVMGWRNKRADLRHKREKWVIFLWHFWAFLDAKKKEKGRKTQIFVIEKLNLFQHQGQQHCYVHCHPTSIPLGAVWFESGWTKTNWPSLALAINSIPWLSTPRKTRGLRLHKTVTFCPIIVVGG